MYNYSANFISEIICFVFHEHTWLLQDHGWLQRGQFCVHVGGPLLHHGNCHCLLAQSRVGASTDQIVPVMPWSVVLQQLYINPRT